MHKLRCFYTRALTTSACTCLHTQPPYADGRANFARAHYPALHLPSLCTASVILYAYPRKGLVVAQQTKDARPGNAARRVEPVTRQIE
eukprot:5583848-Pleurochrysis_carterae.AAC.2